MGISFHEYKFLEHISNLNKFGSVLTLGKQEIILDSFDKTRLNLTNNSYINDQYIDQLLINNFNAKSVKSIDNSKFEGADIIMDMNKPIENINEKFDTIIDFGTSEHIFNVTQNLKNISQLCKIGGTILHSLPANNNCGHGFWQFSPELFFSLYSEANGFSETEIFVFNTHNKYEWWKVNKQEVGERLELSSDVPLYIAVKTSKKLDKDSIIVQQSDYVERWNDKIELNKNNKNNISIMWKKIKDNSKKFFFNFFLPKKFSDKMKGLRSVAKNNFEKNKNLTNIKF